MTHSVGRPPAVVVGKLTASAASRITPVLVAKDAALPFATQGLAALLGVGLVSWMLRLFGSEIHGVHTVTWLVLGHFAPSASGATFSKRWYFCAPHRRFGPIPAPAEAVRRHNDNPLTYFKHPVTNAMSEGFNRKIQTIKSVACGLRNIEHFKAAIYFHRGALGLCPC